MDQEAFRERRRSRLRAEILDAGLSLRLGGAAGEALLAEIDHARFPPVHEREFPTYGAILVSAASLEDVGGVIYRVPGGGDDLVRRMADGRQAFVLRHRSRLDLVVLPTPHDREGEVVRLRQQVGSSGFAAVQRTPTGAVRVFGRARLAVWDGAHWWEKPYASTYAKAVLRAVPDASPAAVGAILDFCVHALSPAPSGAILVLALDDQVVTTLSAGSGTRPPVLALEDRITHGPARQLLSQVDGAGLLTPRAELVDVGLYLPASAHAYASVAIDPAHGTRHASARRFSSDEHRVVVFVVSEDGPVTVYYKGEVVASIRSRLEEESG